VTREGRFALERAGLLAPLGVCAFIPPASFRRPLQPQPRPHPVTDPLLLCTRRRVGAVLGPHSVFLGGVPPRPRLWLTSSLLGVCTVNPVAIALPAARCNSSCGFALTRRDLCSSGSSTSTVDGAEARYRWGGGLWLTALATGACAVGPPARVPTPRAAAPAACQP
jgi:hypothetical protein